MKKTDLIDVVAEKCEIKKKDAARIITAVFEGISDALVDGEKVAISNFGIFEVRERAERLGINPATKERIMIKPSKNVSFKAGKTLKACVNEE